MLTVYQLQPAPTRRRPTARQAIRAELLAVNRSIAGALGLNPSYAISSNISMLVARSLRIPFGAAKLWFHAGIAGFASLLLRLFGLSHVMTVGLGVLTLAWLESFDSSRQRL